MTRPTPASVALIGPEGHETATLGRELEAVPGLRVQRSDGTLTQLNGTALRLTEAHDLVIFRTDEAQGLDLDAVRLLHRAPGRRAILVALAPPDIPLSEARRLMQAGVDDVLPWTVGAEELRSHVERWIRPAAPAASEAPARRGRIVTVAQARGGLGASTLAVNLADRMLDRTRFKGTPRHTVALVDLDLQWGSIASLLDLPPSDALWQMAAEGLVPDATFIGQALAQSSGGLSVLTAPRRLAPLEALRPEQVAALLDVLAARFDHVVVDLPRALVEWVGAVIERTDRLMLVTDCAVPTVRQARRLLDIVLEDNPGIEVEVVVAQDRRPLIRGAHHVEAQRLLGRPLRHWLPHDPAAARRAADRGLPLSAAASGAKLTRGIAALGRATLLALAKPAAPARAVPVALLPSPAASASLAAAAAHR